MFELLIIIHIIFINKKYSYIVLESLLIDNDDLLISEIILVPYLFKGFQFRHLSKNSLVLDLTFSNPNFGSLLKFKKRGEGKFFRSL